MIKLVVFDWNGVLIADANAVVEVEKEVFKAFGHAPISMKRYRDIFTMPVRAFFVAAGFSEREMDRNAVKIQKLFHSLYEPRSMKVRTRTGARTLLEFLAKNKIEAIILSNHTKEGIESQLRRLRLGHYFSRVISNDTRTTMEQKNKALKFAELVARSGYRKNEVIIIGDSPEEIEAARLAGTVSVAITGGYYSTRRLKAAKPDHLISSLTQMIGIIKTL